MQNKFIIPTISILSLLLISGVAYAQINKPEQKIVTNLNLSSTSQLVSATKSQTISSSSQISSSVIVVSSSEMVKVVEIPKVEQPKVEVPQQKTVQAPVNKPTYEFNYQLNQIGGLNLSNFDISFLNENIGDVADYYYNSVQPIYPNQKLFINSYGVQKIDDLNYLIGFNTTFIPRAKEGQMAKIFDSKVYTFVRTNEHDGLFEVTNLKSIDANILNTTTYSEISPSISYEDKNNSQTVEIPSDQLFHD